jgi:5-methylcytosine-specific restriction endonuclease McrA
MVSRADRLLVTERAALQCEYCRAPQVVTGVTFHVEHITPSSRGGGASQENYALSCITCNGHKSDHITGIDPEAPSVWRRSVPSKRERKLCIPLCIPAKKLCAEPCRSVPQF